ncbi:Uncharacterised protein [Mycobacteroides abscessus subsp. bolletii]|uniref:Uncharacterized protein n=1 Tax=Mycobacteroides abscessus subsp. bolletii TaxID=319705 RepID=A0A9Q7SDV7_9MYCO|nr:hypothetical protein [Mycobacteroides abscessus]MDO3333833.1 hypothetical protein [Mycobacteroides abscessus subsp. bolletii]UEA51217.1 hypothetical protein LK451_11065 [Mycobacteroides abscessus subsp. abscessus]UEA55841.1 hypothetical protein LK468_01540 [Mycobacteroides abscessus]SHT73177.1 Uncharacterised protein [Mycobacteroides abscessus subsp. bolletii]SHU11024.1 Uncharacterised protein [Mycobacteroides abscessus subsp. bolletii]
MFDTLGDGGLIDVIMSSQRAEAQAASCRLSAIGVFVDRHADLEREHPRDRFAVDRWDEVAAQVAAAQGLLTRWPHIRCAMRMCYDTGYVA